MTVGPPEKRTNFMHWGILNKPFPINTWRWYRLRSLCFGLFIFLFLFLFRPFSLHLLGTMMLLYTSLVYGCITFLVLLTGGFAFIKLIIPRMTEDRWTLGRQILWNIALMVCIATLNVFVIQFIYGLPAQPLLVYGIMLKWVIMLGVFPIVIADLISYNYFLQRNLKSARQLSQLLPPLPPSEEGMQVTAFFTPTGEKNNREMTAAITELPDQPDQVEKNTTALPTSRPRLTSKVCLIGENQGDKLEIAISDLIAAQALDNYVHIFWEKEGCLQTTLLRNTLTNIALQLENREDIYRTHRGWIVNKKQVLAVDGNAQGLKLTVRLMQLKVPVSRGQIAGYRQQTGFVKENEMLRINLPT